MSLQSLVYIPFHIAPGIYIRVIDEIYPDVSHPEKFNGLCFIASDIGPANKLVPITTPEQFLKTFGAPKPNQPWTGYIAYNHSQYATVYIIRLLPKDATEANLTCVLGPLNAYEYSMLPNRDFVQIWNDILASNTKDDLDLLGITVDSNGNKSVNITDVNAAKNTFLYDKDTNKPIYVLKYVNLPNSDYDIVQPGDQTQNIREHLPLFRFYGLGKFYNRYSVSFQPTPDRSFDFIIYNTGDDNIDRIIATFPKKAIFKQRNEFGEEIHLISNRMYSMLTYQFREDSHISIKSGIFHSGNFVILKYDYENRKYIVINRDKFDAYENDGLVYANELSRSIFNFQDPNNLKFGSDPNRLQNGSDGSLYNQYGQFRYDVFASMVIDALYGRSELTGHTSSYLREPIYDLLSEDLFIKYIYDPTDQRFSLIDRNRVHIALFDYAKTRYFNNTGAVVLGNVGPIDDPMDKQELDDKVIVRSELFTAYGSIAEGVLNGDYYNRWPQLLYVARDLIRYRVARGQVDSFAGAIAAQHSGIKDLPRKYTLAERDQLTLRGINFLVKDHRYGIYTDLGRTTYPFNSALRWLYVIEDLIDMKYEIMQALKPFLHKLETYNWQTLVKRLENLILKPRRNIGLITDYSIQIVPDENYILQNILPIIVSVRYARSIERISVTIYVR